MTSSAVADVWAKLMTGLGYQRYAAAGGDIGSGVTQALAKQHPDTVTGIHLTDADYRWLGRNTRRPSPRWSKSMPTLFKAGGLRKALTPCCK